MPFLSLVIPFIVRNWQIFVGLGAVLLVYLWFQGELREAYKKGVFDEHTRMVAATIAKNNDKLNIIEKAATELEVTKKETITKFIPVERKVYEYIQVAPDANACKTFNPDVLLSTEYIRMLNDIASGGQLQSEVSREPAKVLPTAVTSVRGENS